MPISSLHESLLVSVVQNPSPSQRLSSLHLRLLPNGAENESDTVLHLPAPAERENDSIGPFCPEPHSLQAELGAR